MKWGIRYEGDSSKYVLKPKSGDRDVYWSDLSPEKINGRGRLMFSSEEAAKKWVYDHAAAGMPYPIESLTPGRLV